MKNMLNVGTNEVILQTVGFLSWHQYVHIRNKNNIGACQPTLSSSFILSERAGRKELGPCCNLGGVTSKIRFIPFGKGK